MKQIISGSGAAFGGGVCQSADEIERAYRVEKIAVSIALLVSAHMRGIAGLQQQFVCTQNIEDARHEWRHLGNVSGCAVSRPLEPDVAALARSLQKRQEGGVLGTFFHMAGAQMVDDDADLWRNLAEYTQVGLG